ncbi:hypothetical protein QUA56_13255 [Microcoleus sp. N3A4]|uniref:hypothetical protein n=1 Tax=Microcoleus sp. N3A4 TaxID=3055379 RepID=UPI002FD13485
MRFVHINCHFNEGRRKKEEGRSKKEEGRRKKEEGRSKKEEVRRKKEEGRGSQVLQSRWLSKVGIAHPKTGDDINPYCLIYTLLLWLVGRSGIRKTNRRNVNLCLTN